MRWTERATYLAIIGLLLLAASVLWNNLIRAKQVHLYMSQCDNIPHCTFWVGKYGGPRRDMSQPLDEDLSTLWADVLTRSRDKSFVFEEPEVFQTTKDADRLYVPPGGIGIMAVALSSNRIIFSTEHMNVMDDNERCFVMAHELGHQVDNQTERLDHPFFEEYRYADHENFADEFGAHLCGQGAYWAFMSHWKVPWWWFGFDQ